MKVLLIVAVTTFSDNSQQESLFPCTYWPILYILLGM